MNSWVNSWVNNSDSFAGKRALITGGAKRLGRETALALTRAGASLAIHYNASSQAAETLCREIGALGGAAVTLQADLSRSSEVESLFNSAWTELGTVDFLVNNASIFPAGGLDDLEIQDLHQNLQVNAWAPFLLTREFWRKVRETGDQGSVVNLLDTRLMGGDLAHAAYHLSKAALLEFTKLTALQFSPYLQVNGVAPGAVMPPEGFGEEYLDGLVANLPLSRRGYPKDIADAIVFLLGTSFVTGQVIFVDGGRHLRPGGSP